MLAIAITTGVAFLLGAVLVGYLRNRRCDYLDIAPGEVNAEVAAGEELLQDVLSAGSLAQEGKLSAR